MKAPIIKNLTINNVVKSDFRSFVLFRSIEVNFVFWWTLGGPFFHFKK